MSLALLGVDAAPRGILIRVKNARALAAKEGGASGAIAATLMPETIEGVVLQKMVDQFKSSLREKGVDADVQIVAAEGHGRAESGFAEGALVGAGAAGAAWLLGKLVRR